MRARTVRGNGPLGEWEMTPGRPHESLCGHVARYLGYWERTRFGRRREAPIDVVPLIINLGPPLRVSSEARSFDLGLVAGLSDATTIVDSGGEQAGVQIDFTPIGAALLLARPLAEFTNRVIGLDDVFGSRADELVCRLRELSCWDDRFALLDGVIARRFAAAPGVPADLVWAWRRLKETDGGVAISALAREIGCSRKHLTARFTDHIGLPPKTMARIIRFHAVVADLAADPNRRLTELAQQRGYYDQSHLIRDFREFAGITPTEHLRRSVEGTGVVAD